MMTAAVNDDNVTFRDAPPDAKDVMADASVSKVADSDAETDGDGVRREATPTSLLWDRSSLYSSQLSVEDLLWTDWFSETDANDAAASALVADQTSAPVGVGETRRRPPKAADGGAAGFAENDGVEARILHRTHRGQPRRCLGSNLVRGRLLVSLWCDASAVADALRAQYGAASGFNPATVVRDAPDLVGRTEQLASEVGLAVAMRATAPVPWSTCRSFLAASSPSKPDDPTLSALDVDALRDQLRAAHILYDGVLGLPVSGLRTRAATFLSHLPWRASPKDAASATAEVAGQGSKPPPPWLQRAGGAIQRTVRAVSSEFVAAGTSLVVEWRDDAPTGAGARRGDRDGCVDVLAVSPIGVDGERAVINLGSSTQEAGRHLIARVLGGEAAEMAAWDANSNPKAVMPSDSQSLRGQGKGKERGKERGRKNYAAMGLGYAINGFDRSTWRVVLPAWRRFLRSPSETIAEALPERKGKGQGRGRGRGRGWGEAARGATLGMVAEVRPPTPAFAPSGFEVCDLRAGNPIPSLLGRRSGSGQGKKGRFLFQLH